MSSTSSTAHSVNKNPKIFKIDLDRNLYCKHDLIVVRRVVQRKSSRIGQEFYGCPLWPVKYGLQIFLWKEDVYTMFKEHESRMTSLLPENPKSYEVIKMRILELEKMLLTEENKHLKEMLQKSNAKYKIRNVLGLDRKLKLRTQVITFKLELNTTVYHNHQIKNPNDLELATNMTKLTTKMT
ncbi:hypothetical protein R6Q59_030862 [Mikania micrantha]